MLENHYRSLPIQNVLKVPSYGFEEIKGFSEKVYLGDTIAFKVFELEDDNLSINEILKKSEEFKPASYFTGKTNPKNIYWIELDFRDNLDSIKNSSILNLKFTSFDYGILFLKKKEAIEMTAIGLFNKQSTSKRIMLKNYLSQREIVKGNLINNQYLYLKVKRVTFNEKIHNWKFSFTPNVIPNGYTINDFKNLFPYYFFAGLCLLMWLSTLSSFFFLRKKEFLFYSFYVFTLFIYVTGDIFGIYDYFFSGYGIVQHWFSQSFILFANIAYAFFFMHYIRTKKDYPLLHFLMKTIIALHILVLGIMFIFYSQSYLDGLNYIVGTLMKIVYFLSIIVMVYIIVKAKNPLAYFVGFASIAFLIGTLAHVYLASPDDGLLLNSRYFLLIGCSVEIIIFAFGLNYKVNLEFQENLSLQKKASIEKAKALRAQLNPHFIFNSLNAIQHLVTLNDKKSTLKYISKFGNLIRSVLESSIETNAMLNEEIKMIEDYLELESLRFDNAFSYKINIDENLDLNTIEIPFMILQPFVENAIIHGLLPKKNGPKQLIINFKEENGFVVCEIDDNGVGRRHVKKEKRSYQKEKKSRGLEITKQRLASLNKHQDAIKILDKYIDGKSSGTKVTIKIPL
ncbi:sensor histidine kinase [Flagellimonas maritima]|nr:histidine kinase [Allomuricauda aurantiaca]